MVVTLVCCTVLFAQSASSENSNVLHGVALTFVSQRCLPKTEVPYVGDDFIDYSDMSSKFRLVNRSSTDIYYLVAVVTDTQPVGFQLVRANKRADWEALHSPARGRDGVFTGDGYTWRLLSRGAAIYFDTLDFSGKRGERATSVFVNSKPMHGNRMELISNSFVPVRCRKA